MKIGTQKTRLSRQGRWGFVILFGAALLMGTIATLPFLWLNASQAKLAESRQELQFLETKRKSQTGAQVPQLTEADDVGPLFVEANTAGLATAELQSLIGKVAEANGMVVQRTQPLQSDSSGKLTVLRMEVETSGSIENLVGYLHALETGQPLLMVNSAKITAAENPDQSGSALPSDKLTVALLIEAYGWTEDQR